MSCGVVGFGETVLRLTPPYGGRLENAHALHLHVAGAESKALACASRLGLRCVWVSALSESPLGRMVARELRRHGVGYPVGSVILHAHQHTAILTK
jgi:2-dehydro-3-deoxygluconokinase